MELNLQKIQDFLFYEAELLDDGKLEDWLKLYTDDCIYWIPCNQENYDPDEKVSIVYETKEQLIDRVERLNSGFAYGQLPPSRVHRLIGNIRVVKQEDNIVHVRSRALISELRRGVMTHYPVKYEHQLVLNGDEHKIKYKKTTLLNLDEPLGNISFLL